MAGRRRFLIGCVAAALAAGISAPSVSGGTEPECDTAFRPVETFDMRGIDTAIGIGAAGEDVWAIGSTYSGNGDYRIFGYHYNGIEWETLPEPEPDDGSYIGYGADVDPSGNVWVVGEHLTTGTNERHLVLRWDGTSWEQMSVPQIGVEGRLMGIEALAPDDAWAVGAYDDGNESERGVIVHYDGSSWTKVRSVGRDWTELYDVSFSAPDHGWISGDGLRRGLLMKWDGSTWSKTKVPSRRISVGAIEAVSADRAWASAGREIGWGPPDGRMLKWDGDDWTRVDIPDPRGSEGYYDIDSNGLGVWAVGGRYRREQRWDPWAIVRMGARWRASRVEAQAREERFASVVATPEGPVWAVGNLWTENQPKLVVYGACS